MITDAEDTSMELALGLSEYFEALKKIEGGDPEVSVSEDSGNELIAQLGRLLNRTAKGVAALVDDSHEMAMGLCANFEILTRLAEGDLSARAVEDCRVELLGRLGQMINRVSGQLQVLAVEASAIAGGDLTRTLQLNGDLPDAFNQMAAGLRTLVGRTREYASRVASASTQILSASEEQAAAAAEEAAQVSEIAAAAKELAATAKRVSDLGKDISKSSAGSLDLAQSGIEAANDVVIGMDKIRESVLDTAKKIEALGEKSQSITEITSLIEDIADQTNLLSVNAAIEAARAGEAGKGFAVVADAIGSLAERTAKSTKDISDLIKSMQQETSACVMSMEESTQLTDHGASLAQKAGEKLREVAGAFESVAHSAKEVSLSSQQQMSASEEISKAMAEIDEIVKQSANSAKESTNSARDLSELAAELGEAIAQFKISTDEHESEEDIDEGTGSAERTEESSREWHASLINQR
jgi:methyl-accepting chemotaxis protein